MDSVESCDTNESAFNEKLRRILDDSVTDFDIEDSQVDAVVSQIDTTKLPNTNNLPGTSSLPDSSPVSNLNDILCSLSKTDVRFITGVNHVLFINKKGECMHFVLLLDDAIAEKEITEKIFNHLGTVTTNVQEVGPHSAVLVKDDANQWPYSRDLFKVSYINDCIEEGKIRDISKYLKCTSREFTPDLDYMKIVYHRTYTWDNVPEEFKQTLIAADTDQSNMIDNVVDSDTSSDIVSNAVCPVNVDIDADPDIDSCIPSNVGLDKPCISSYKNAKATCNTNEIASNEPSIPPCVNADEPCTSSHASIEPDSSSRVVSLKPCASSRPVSNQPCIRPLIDSSKQCVPSRSDKNDCEVTSQIEDDSYASQESDDDDKVKTSLTQTNRVSSTVNKRTRAGYSMKEKSKMIRYIVDNNRYANVKGVQLWREMETENICPMRTWQSMKEHFRKTIVKQLDHFHFLGPVEKQKIKRAFQ